MGRLVRNFLHLLCGIIFDIYVGHNTKPSLLKSPPFFQSILPVESHEVPPFFAGFRPTWENIISHRNYEKSPSVPIFQQKIYEGSIQVEYSPVIPFLVDPKRPRGRGEGEGGLVLYARYLYLYVYNIHLTFLQSAIWLMVQPKFHPP